MSQCFDVWFLFQPGGSIFLTTLNRTTASWIGSIILAEKVLKILPNNTHDWEKYIKPQELKLMLEDSKCRHFSLV